MPGVFIGSTEITAVGKIKAGGTDVQEIYVGATKIWPPGGGGGITFTWDPENDQALPGGATFTRASLKQEYDGTDYTELASGAIPENSAAVGGGAQGFNPEPSATNQMITIDLSDGAWSKNDFSAGALAASSIGLDANEITATGSGGHFAFDGPQSTANGSAYGIVQADTGQFLTIRRGGDAATDYVCYDWVTGTVTEEGTGVDSSDITDLGAGWYKGDVSTLDGAGFLALGIVDTGTPGAGAPGFPASGENFLIAHVQYETTNFTTSPIRTSGSVQTRVADVLDTGVAITTAFSALLDVTLPVLVGAGQTITLLGPDTTAEDVLRVDDTGAVIMDDGGTPVTIGTVTLGTRFKISYGRDGSGRSASLNGATAVTGGAPGAGHVGENFELGSRAGINQSRCIHHLTTLYDSKLSDAELETLST